ncbi:hypothetical protein NDU88_001378 [Pleurodeles waltl]|uniref:Uncharacterized protein n=1 Tax=Pleurodeles waltl TaxID=8319 RepID=A0AAV7V9H5_PLEWA|nr:hypothetical protein NDU88_001378 [Pleurodeles waltl]
MESMADKAFGPWGATECCGHGGRRCGCEDAEGEGEETQCGLGCSWSLEEVGGIDRAAEGRIGGPGTPEFEGGRQSGPDHERLVARWRSPQAKTRDNNRIRILGGSVTCLLTQGSGGGIAQHDQAGFHENEDDRNSYDDFTAVRLNNVSKVKTLAYHMQYKE